MSVPDMPAGGSLVADLDTLKVYVGARTTQDDVLLQDRLNAATEWVYERVYDDHRDHTNVQEAILLVASRLYKRRQSPEGVTGFGGEGEVIRVVARDPDVRALLVRHLNMCDVGIA